MNKLDWNRERYRTRDLLLSYELVEGPPDPQSINISAPYPWEDFTFTRIVNTIYDIAHASGYEDDMSSFLHNFGSLLEYKSIIYANYEDFPTTGDAQHLYFDLNEKILYYWENEYIPINTLLINNTILKGGGA